MHYKYIYLVLSLSESMFVATLMLGFSLKAKTYNVPADLRLLTSLSVCITHLPVRVLAERSTACI
jgi:hypothetical protein